MAALVVQLALIFVLAHHKTQIKVILCCLRRKDKATVILITKRFDYIGSVVIISSVKNNSVLYCCQQCKLC